MDIPKYKIIGWSIVLLVVMLFAFYVYEFDYIGNTIHFKNLLWKFMLAACLIGVYLGWRFQSKGEEQIDKIRIWSIAILLPMFFAPWLGSLTNRLFASGKTVYQTVEFIEEKPFSKSYKDIFEIMELEADGCFLFIFHEGEIHRLKRDQCTFFNNKNGDKISLPMTEGFWGYDVFLKK